MATLEDVYKKYDNLIFDLNQEELVEKEIMYLDSLSDKELEELLKRMGDEAHYYDSLQTGEKLILNSIYGAFGNAHFVCSDVNIAGGITAMGRHLVKFVDNINEEYWYNYWHLDYDLHEKLGIDSDSITPIDPQWIHRESRTNWDEEYKDELVEDGIIQRKFPVSVYIDTDSIFVSFEHVFKSCNWTGDRMKFVMTVCKERLENLFETKLNGLAKSYKVKNLQKFDLENVCESVIFLTKKKYLKHILWEDGRSYDRLVNISPKGVQLIQRGTPKFARDKVLEILTYIFDNYELYHKNKNAMLKYLLTFVQKLRKEIEVTDIDDITRITSVNNYHSHKLMSEGQMIDGPGIIEDTPELGWAKGTYYMLKAGALYNHLLHQNPELQNKYGFITPGDRVKYYDCHVQLNKVKYADYITPKDHNTIFAFPYGKHPIEFAPPIDYDELFLKTISKQVNFYLEALDLPELNKRLSVVMSIF